MPRNWRLYVYEGLGLAWLVFIVGIASALLFAADSPLQGDVDDGVRRLIVGIAVGIALAAVIYSPIGRASGAHINPAVTLVFFRLGRMTRQDTTFYILAQFAGAVLGIAAFSALLGSLASDPGVNYVATAPEEGRALLAFGAEIGGTFAIVYLILFATNRASLAPLTGWLVGALLALIILIFGSVSGASLNPARSFGPALIATSWDFLWLYFLAPPIGALLASEAYSRFSRGQPIKCAKLNHYPSGHPKAADCRFPGCQFAAKKASSSEHR